MRTILRAIYHDLGQPPRPSAGEGLAIGVLLVLGFLMSLVGVQS